MQPSPESPLHGLRSRLGLLAALAVALTALTATRGAVIAAVVLGVVFAGLLGHVVRDVHRMAGDLREALKDSLTGMLNHRALQDRLREELARAARTETPLAVLALDVDGFKAVNDAHGHAVGDDALRRIAAAMRDELRASDVCGRVGGDEFVIVLPGADVGTAAGVAERLRSRVVRTAAAVDLPLTVSIGVAGFPRHSTDQDALLHYADSAMYWSKSNGKDKVTVFASDRDLALSADEAAERNLRAGLVNTVHALARAVDAKDGYTHSHSQRVASYALAVGRRSGWGRSACSSCAPPPSYTMSARSGSPRRSCSRTTR